MEVILREHVDKLGRRGDIVKVADGYARNYLLPQKLALPVTEVNKRRVERERQVVEAREDQERAAAEALVARLAELECVIARKVGETGALYGSVTAVDIVESLARQGFTVDKRRVHLDEPLKQAGEFTVPVKLHREVVGEVKVKVVPEEQP